MAYVSKAEILEVLAEFPSKQCASAQIIFATDSVDELADILVEHINIQPQINITHSLVIAAMEHHAREIEKELDNIMWASKNAQNAQNN